MFARQRKARVLFGLSDIILAALSFAGSYQTRSVLHLHWVFYLTFDQKVLILGFSLSALVVTGLWLEIYEKLDAAHPRLILRDTARQCAYAGLCLVIFEYLLRLDLSRFFLGTFLAYTWTAMLLFRLTAGRVAGTLRREFARPHYVMVVGTGERAQRLGELLEASADYGIRLHGFLSDDAGFRRVPMVLEGKYPVKPIAELPALLRQHVIDEIIFAVESDRLSELEEYFLLCDEEGVRTRVAV
ncbi:MAG: sugar transferase, partial [Acidobacteriia bacterium]|nr:sugar transferase [Terriglobia bacterium]